MRRAVGLVLTGFLLTQGLLYAVSVAAGRPSPYNIFNLVALAKGEHNE